MESGITDYIWTMAELLTSRDGFQLLVGHYGETTMRYVLVAALILTASNHALGQKDVTVKTIDKIKRSIVPIVCGYTDENKVFKVVEVAGSGFFIDTFGRFITANHVLDNWDRISREKHVCFPVIYVPNQPWGGFKKNVDMQWFTFISCSRDSTLDLAVCQPIENPFASTRVHRENIAPVTFDTKEWPDGTSVGFTGFPLEFTFPITSKGFVGGKLAIESSDTYYDLVIDKSAWPGASGSMVYLSNGKVIGMIRATGVSLASGLAYARTAAAIVDFLSKHPYAPNSQQPPNQQH